VFVLGPVVIISRLIDGKYPDYRQIIPKESEVVAEVNREEFISVVRVASLFAKESAGSIMIRVQEESQDISVEAVASQVGENTSSTAATVRGSGEVSLNSRYLIDALQVMTSEKVSFKLSGRHNPCVLQPSEKSADYLHLIMPLKS
jgi:DNA polymerase-3 subunit beta